MADKALTSIEEEFDWLPTIAKPKFLPALNSNKDEKKFGSGVAAGTPIFSKNKLRHTATCTGDFMHVRVCKNWLVCILASGTNVMLKRYFLQRAIPPGEIALEKYLVGYKISKLFFDHTGHHLLIPLVPKSPGLSADFLYIHDNGPKVRRIEKFKDHQITAVAFNSFAGTESSTGAILLGTSRGLIFETELSQDADKPSYRKQVYDLGLGRAVYPITGLELLHMPNSNSFIVIASTPDSIHTFQETIRPEEKSLQAIFTGYVNGAKVPHTLSVKTDSNYSSLNFYAPPNEKYPQHWGWLCGIGLQVGKVLPETTETDAELLVNESTIAFEQQKHLSYDERRQHVPRAFVLTEYHALLLYHDHLTGICLPSQEVVYEEYFHEHGKLLNIVRDHFTGAIYVYTDKTVFQIKITDEQRDIWQIYMQKGWYDIAEVHAATNTKHLNTVLTNKADATYDAGRYEEAANIYADTQEPFEEICLKFLELEDQHPLISYVRKQLRKTADEAEHVKMLVMWVVDLYLTQINYPGREMVERSKWQREFNEFMAGALVAKCARENREDIEKLITQHADPHNLSQFAIANEDYEEVIKQLMGVEKYAEALATLRKQKNLELYYKYCPIIMEYLPHEVVDVLMSLGRKLQVPELMPTLIVTESPKHVEEIIKYLEFAVYKLGETDETIHDYLLRLYAEHKPEKVIGYLENEGHDVTLVHYDKILALDVCMEFKLNAACVFLQCLLCMWSIAVDLALTFDMALAKETASKPRSEETCRKLWLRIACHEIQGTNDVEKALDLLKECELLRIEDLLPYFSDFEKIDDFKKPICQALKEYNQKIRELQQDMEECDKQAARVRSDLQNVRERSVRIGAHESCMICESVLLVKPFFVFTCGHKFHHDCLEKQIIPMLNSERSRRLTMVKQQLESSITQSAATAEISQAQHQQRDKLKKEIEQIIASDCLYCGLMIDTIDKPFVEDWDQVNVDWE